MDRFDDGSTREAVDLHMKKIQSFVQTLSLDLSHRERDFLLFESDFWDGVSDPIEIVNQPFERTNVLELVSTPNEQIKKVLLIFGSLCHEMVFLTNEAKEKFYPGILLFGQIDNFEEGDSQVAIGKMIPFFVDMVNFVNRCNVVVKNLMQQLNRLYNPRSQLFNDYFKKVKLRMVFKYLGDLLRVLDTFDVIFESNKQIPVCWGRFKWLVNRAKQEPENFDEKYNEGNIWKFEELLHNVQDTLMNGFIFDNCIHQAFDDDENQVTRNEVLKSFFLETLAWQYSLVDEKTPVDRVYRNRFMNLTVLFTFFVTLYNDENERKLFRKIWALYKRVPIIHVFANVTFDSCEFFMQKIPFFVERAKPGNLSKYKTSYMNDFTRSFSNNVNNLNIKAQSWMLKMDTESDEISYYQYVIREGLEIARVTSNLYRTFLYLHYTTSTPLKASQILDVCRCLEIVKAVQASIRRNSMVVSHSVRVIISRISGGITKILEPYFRDLAQNNATKGSNRVDIDMQSAIALSMQLLNGTITSDRVIVLSLLFHQIFSVGMMSSTHANQISELISVLEEFCNFDIYFREAVDCSCILWSKAIIPIFFKNIFTNPDELGMTPFFFSAINDVSYLLRKAVHTDPEELIKLFLDFIESKYETEVISKLVAAIQEDLLVQIHEHTKDSVVAKDDRPHPFLSKDYSKLLNLKSFAFAGTIFNIRERVTHCLDIEFYKLNSVALYDWQTYSEMRSLAKSKYGLDLQEVYLPGQTLEQSLDILRIMRLLPSFVRHYCYDMNNQLFIEKKSDKNNTLATINIQNIASSLKIHGGGIMNTTVSVTYQFLNQKIHVFSTFIFDEKINARLSRLARLYDEEKENLNTMYPYDEAKELAKYIEGLGDTADGKTYLQAFRDLVTEIGNSMGFVRLIRSGGLLHTNNMIRFVPDLSTKTKLCDFIQAEDQCFSEETKEATQNLDDIVRIMVGNFSEGTDYFSTLVNTFSAVYKNTEHLENFYIIIPALTINYVKHILKCKDKFSKRGKEEGTFTDDGFSIGLAFLLAVLEQNTPFNSLHWFRSANQYYKREMENLSSKKKEKRVKTAHYRQDKLVKSQKEFKLLKYSLESARIFFIR
eukprot:TRINITY_DN8032_c0_g1_i1.p1 TRINITY_DN8032_c0_g1~~TRINITY_DN8032_c0_g1_i1.p1  ORF type:complete len:1108 (-),score=219.26 TRINITY_DN8032_c0_g1_i1:5-3328(-)